MFLVPIALLFAGSQLLAQHAETLADLWRTSTVLGFAYGCIFSLLPMVVLETFGVANFAAVSAFPNECLSVAARQPAYHRKNRTGVSCQ